MVAAESARMTSNKPCGALQAHAKSRSQRVVAKLQEAMKTIEAEIDSQDGIYSFNGGRLSRAEVCRRAGIASAVLEGKAHKTTTLVALNRWLDSIRERLIGGHKKVRQAVTRRADDWKARAQQFANQAHLYHLQMISLEHRLQEARARIAELDAENGRLSSEVSDGRVVSLNERSRR